MDRPKRIESIDAIRGFDMFWIMGLAALLPDGWPSVVIDAGYVVVCWLFLYFLYRKKVFLKV